MIFFKIFRFSELLGFPTQKCSLSTNLFQQPVGRADIEPLARQDAQIDDVHITGSLDQQSFLACLIRQAVKVLVSAADRNVVTAAQKAAVVDSVFDLASSDASDNAFSPTPNSG